MKRIGGILFIFVLVGLMPLVGFAQNPIPNPSFENWSGGNPVDWWTNNVPPTLIPITQSTDAHNGSYSVRLEVVDGGGFPYGAALYSGTNGFTCNQRYANVTGYYKFSPQNPTSFTISVNMIQNGALIGSGSQVITTAALSWTQFNVPIVYFDQRNPDTCRVDFQVVSQLTTGAVAYIDELTLSGTTGMDDLNNGQIPAAFELKQNYPNPFNPTTNIEFSIPRSADVNLVVYNQLGQTVATLVNERLSTGSYSLDWNAEELPSGVYYYHIFTDGFSNTRKMVLLQ